MLTGEVFGLVFGIAFCFKVLFVLFFMARGEVTSAIFYNKFRDELRRGPTYFTKIRLYVYSSITFHDFCIIVSTLAIIKKNINLVNFK